MNGWWLVGWTAGWMDGWIHESTDGANVLLVMVEELVGGGGGCGVGGVGRGGGTAIKEE